MRQTDSQTRGQSRARDEDGCFDLTFFATGECQHVFLETGAGQQAWVYKIPAAFGYIHPESQTHLKFKPRSAGERIMRRVLVRLPHKLERVFGQWPGRCAGALRLAETSAAPRLAARLVRLPIKVGSRTLAAYYKWERRQRFDRMLETIGHLSRHGLDDILLPYKIIRRAKAALRIGGRVINYEGPILLQRKSDFFVKYHNFNSFDWNELVAAQHRLWQHGVAFEAPSEAIGPKNWALLNGRLYLGDTGGLTRNWNRAVRTLSEENLSQKAKNLLDYAKANNLDEPVEEYLQFIRKEINLTKLKQLWRTRLL